ncbi:MAG: polyprenyl synthetase family protein [bacterium]|nr:polyprenyl synthetase family protein [bacterium]
MIIEQELKNFKTVFDKEMEKFLDLKIVQAKKISPEASGAVQNLKNYVLGSGKRIRPALMYYAYLALGGKNKKEALRLAMASEFIHAFLIIHDDVIDRDDFRRGMPSIHCIYKKIALKDHYSVSAPHYGNSQAISIGDMCFSFVGEIISQSKFNRGIKDKLLKKISDIVFNTTIGQFHDVFAAAVKNGIDEKHVLTILEYKTARYTVEGPLHLGAIMAGASGRVLKSLSDFSIPLGIAFQIQDDILGVFGSSQETGKPVGADIREGKKTLLIVRALEQASANQKKDLHLALGNDKAGREQIERARKIIIDIGSLEYSKRSAEKLVNASRLVLTRSNLNKESKEFFSAVAEFMIKRDH